jgi:hypothetical protein
MKYRKFLLMMLTVSLCIAKKPPPQHDWETGTLLNILPIDAAGVFRDPENGMTSHISGAVAGTRDGNPVMLEILRRSSSFSLTAVLALLDLRDQPGSVNKWDFRGPNRVAVLGPAIRPHEAVQYAIETVPCKWIYNCGYEPVKDEYGRTVQKKITERTYLYLLDAENRVFRVTAVKEFKLPPRKDDR